MTEEILTVDEVAAFLRVHRITVYRLIASGKLHPFRVGRVWRFYQRDVVELAGASSFQSI
jgi:excisionase family DNA binding protein